MKIGAMVPQGWRMDLHGIEPKHQWNTILESSAKIEKLKYESLLNELIYHGIVILVKFHLIHL